MRTKWHDIITIWPKYSMSLNYKGHLWARPCQQSWSLSFQSTTSLRQPSPSSVWPSWSWGLCVWWDHVLVKAKEETTSSNLLACSSHLQVGSVNNTRNISFSLLRLHFEKPKPHFNFMVTSSVVVMSFHISLLSQVYVPSSHWRWCVSQSSAWSRARTRSGSNTTTPGPSLVPAWALSCYFSLASPSCSSPCPRCQGIHGRLAWTLSRIK